MNLSKLAQIANVSISTVSKAFADSNEISPQTKEMIFTVAKENGCFDKYYKPKYQKKAIAVICPELLGIHYTQMSTFLNNEIFKKGGTMMLSASNFSEKRQQELIEYYTRYAHADGIIVIEPTGIIKNTSEIPIIQIGMDSEAKNVDCVNVVASDAMYDALKYLKVKEYKRIGFIGEKYAKQEYEYFNKAMMSLNMTIDEKYVAICDKRFYDAGYYAMDKMISTGCIPDVVFAAYSHIAVGIMQRIKEEKLSIPSDISIICMDDISSVPYSEIDLSCIKMHLDEVCDTALDLLYHKIEKKYMKAKRKVSVTREFKKGQSVR